MILKRAVKHSNQQSEICLMNEKGEKKGENGNDYPSWKLNTKINFERIEQTKCLQLLASDGNSGQHERQQRQTQMQCQQQEREMTSCYYSRIYLFIYVNMLTSIK